MGDIEGVAVAPLDLLLVNPPSRGKVYQQLNSLSAIEPPVWAGLIATYCIGRGFSVHILDAEAEGLTVEQTAYRIHVADARLTVFTIYGQQPSASTQCLPAASAVVECLHRSRARTRTLALGTHPSALPEKTIREEPFDYVCEGEGPYSIVALLGTENDRTGLWWKIGDGRTCTMGYRAPNIEDLDKELPEQAWRLLGMTKYRAHNWHLWSGDPAGGYASVQTSLGCSFLCHFCCIQAPFGKPGMRFWSPDNVVTQISRAYNEYGITNIKIPDEMFFLNKKHLRGICEKLIAMDLGSRLNMWAYARIDTVSDEKLLEEARNAGFKWLGIGIESGSKHVRDGVEKGRFGDEDIVRAVRRVQEAGIHVAANYIFGLPDDTTASMESTLQMACSLNTEWANFYCAMGYPGSKLHRDMRGKGVLPEELGVGWLGYSQHAYETTPLPTDTVSAADVLRFRDEAFVRYFSRFDYYAMLRGRFGQHAVSNVDEMLALGKPKRKLLGD